MKKLSHMVNGDWAPYSHSATYVQEETNTGGTRLRAGLPAGRIEVLRLLLMQMEPPIDVLYVLHTPRGEGDPGRYQSSKLVLDTVQDFLSRFSDYLQNDARFDLWFHSFASDSTVVWDRHNLVFAYGLLEKFEVELKRCGFSRRDPTVPVPHLHHYREECDADASAVLSYFPWKKSELREEDEQ